MMPMVIQIRMWLMQVEVWRFVGFASAVVGLLCYALSSSFNHLFGEWNLLKIFLYSVFSFIICLLILFVKIWQHSRSLRFKAHTAFLVLTITSVYSFFSDKVMNGKPDAYTLISCAAFAIISYACRGKLDADSKWIFCIFFLGCLIVQLMKIKLQLGIVGVGFSYSLIIFRSSFSSIDATTEIEYPELQDENSVVIEVVTHTPQLAGIDLASMTERLETCVKALQLENLNLKDMLSEHELVESDRDFKEIRQPNENQNLMIEALPPEKVNNLQETAKLMMSAGFEKECCEVYSSCRRECLEEFLMNKLLLRLQQQLSIEDVHKMPWQDLQDEIKRWIMGLKVALKKLFPTERQLCDCIFMGFSSTANLSFSEVCRASTLQLLNFADAVATGSPALERLFRILDMFETLRDLIPEFESLFCDEYSVSLRNEAITTWKRLREVIRGTFVELENAIRREKGKVAIPGGRTHPLARYVMNYLRVACDYRQTLEQVFKDYGHPLKEHPKLDDRMPSSTSLSVQMDWIVELLESNLEAKSKMYKDPALCYVFLMNNSMYIVQRTKDSELGTLLGEDWIRNHTAKVRQYHVQYQRSSWDKVLRILKLDDNGLVLPNGVAKSMKENLESFNKLFEDICRVQSSWFVFDEQLREEIRISLEETLLPAYENFIVRFQSVPELGQHADKYIKYGTEDIQARLRDLFQGHDLLQGHSGSSGSRK